MSTGPSSQFAKPRIDARALLGLYDPADTTDWGPIRAAQLHAGRQLALFLLGANRDRRGAVVDADLDGHRAALGAGRLGRVVAGVVGVAVTFRRLATRAARRAAPRRLRDVRDTVLEGVALARGVGGAAARARPCAPISAPRWGCGSCCRC